MPIFQKAKSGDMIHRVPALSTKSARKLIDLIKTSDPHEWYKNAPF
jgi:hypothetical protein